MRARLSAAATRRGAVPPTTSRERTDDQTSILEDVCFEELREALVFGQGDAAQVALLVLGEGDEAADDAVGLAEGHPLEGQVVGDVGRQQIAAGLAAGADGFELEAQHHLRHDLQGGGQRVVGLEQRLLVLLHVAVVGQRQALHGRQ